MMNNLLGPMSTPVSYTAPSSEGFIGVPRPMFGAPGWGAPLHDEDGKSLWPGTEGGPNSSAAIVKSPKSDTWRARRSLSLQKFGAISWRGKKKKPEIPDSEKYILTYAGPTSRMLPTSFTYGSSSEHRNICADGGIAGIAPGAVVGACLKLISETYYLYVVSYAAGVETVYRRVYSGPTFSDADEEMARMAAMRSTDHPGGWVALGAITIDSEYEGPRIPWFFNASGTEAQTMRRRTKEGTIDGASVEQLAYDRFKLTLGESSFSITNMGNEPPFEFSEDGQKMVLPLWVTTPFAGYEHYWEEMRLSVSAYCTGRQVIGVDYDGDEEVLVYFEVDVLLKMHQDYMKGVDGDYYPSLPDPPEYRNDGIGDGRYGNPFELDVDPAATIGNHTGSIWFGGSVLNCVKFVSGGVEYRVVVESASTLTATEYAGMDYVSTDHDIFQRYYEVQYLRHLDVRAGGFVAAFAQSFKEYPQQQTASVETYEVHDTQLTDNLVNTYVEGDVLHQRFKATYHPALGEFPGISQEYKWNMVEGWSPAPWQWSATTYTGARPKTNDDAAKGNLPVNSWFPTQSAFYRNGWYGIDVIYHGKHQETVSFCHREDGTFILSGELPHPSSGEPTPVKVSHPEHLAGMHEGEVFYPLGEM